MAKEPGRIPLLDVGTVQLIRDGKLATRPNVERFTERGVVFSDGREEQFAAVVLGTGYRPAVLDFVPWPGASCDADGAPQQSGREVQPGLCFCGYYVSPTGMLRESAIEARLIAHSIARDASPTTRSLEKVRSEARRNRANALSPSNRRAARPRRDGSLTAAPVPG